MKTDLMSINPNKYTINALRYCSGLAIIYVILIFALPSNHYSIHQYHLTSVEYHILLFIISIPALLVWYTAFYGVAKLHEYSWSIHKSTDGKHLGRIANGASWIAWGLPVNAILAIILFSLAGSSKGFSSAAIIITNYGQLVMPLIGFSVIAQGTLGLTGSNGARAHVARARGLILLLVSLGVVFCFFTFRQFNLHSVGSTQNPYHLPAWLMMITLLIPFLYAWFLGLLAAYEINSYGQYMRGVLYKQTFRLVAYGLVAVIMASIALQYVRTLYPEKDGLLLDYRLVSTTIFRVIVGLGFALIAYGAFRLKKIEGV